MTISLPRPFILTKAWLESVLMGTADVTALYGQAADRGNDRLLKLISPRCIDAVGVDRSGKALPADLLRAGGAGLLDHLAPTHDLGPDVALQLFRRRAHDRNEAAVGKVLLHLRLGQDGPQLRIELVQDRLGDCRRRHHHLPG